MTLTLRVVKVGFSGMGIGLYREMYSSETFLSRSPQTQKAARTVGAAMARSNGLSMLRIRRRRFLAWSLHGTKMVM